MMLEAYNDLIGLLGLDDAKRGSPPDEHQVRDIIATAEARIASIRWSIEELEKRARARGIDPKPSEH